MKNFFFFILIIFNVIGCKNERQEAEKTNENFNVFIEKFSSDSLFQISRVNFPLKVKELDDDYESVEKKINKNEYRKLDLRYNDSFAKRDLSKYTQNIKLEKNKAIIEIRGIDNGIMTDIYFEKHNGKWNLISWDDSST